MLTLFTCWHVGVQWTWQLHKGLTVNLCKMFRQITEAWESTPVGPVDLKLGNVSSSFISYMYNTTTIS